MPEPRLPQVLFVCVHNAGRSQMAAALLHHHAAGRVDVRSAGSAPGDEINPVVRAAMAELGVDLGDARPQVLTPMPSRPRTRRHDGLRRRCPVFPGRRYLDWDLADPAGKALDEVRLIRDDIDRRVRALLSELTASSST